MTSPTRGALAPLRDRRFAWFYASRFTNILGSAMATVALAFAVLDLTGSAAALGQVLAAHTVPMVAFLLFGGVVADRLPRTLVLQVSNLASGLTQAAVAWLLLSGTAELWMLVVLEAVHGLVSAMSMPAMSALVPQLVPREQLQQANALLSLSRNGLYVVGPSVGALLVVTVGSGWALAVDAATWFLSALLLVPVRLPPRPPRTHRTGVLTELGEGWALFRTTTWLWTVVAAFFLLNAIHAGAWFTLGPARATETIGRQAWGLVLSAEAVGLLLATVVLLRVPLRRPLVVGMLGCSLLGVPMLVLGLAPHTATLVVAAALAGAGMEVFGMGWNLAMQENIPDDQLSRAYSYDALGSFAAMPLGQLAYGPLGERLGYGEVLTVSGLVYLAVALLALTPSAVRGLTRTTAPPAS